MKIVLLIFGIFIFILLALCCLSAMNRTNELLKEMKSAEKIREERRKSGGGGGFQM